MPANEVIPDWLSAEISRQVGDLLCYEYNPSRPSPTLESLSDTVGGQIRTATGFDVRVHPISEEDRRECRIRYTVAVPQHVAIRLTTEPEE